MMGNNGLSWHSLALDIVSLRVMGVIGFFIFVFKDTF